MQHNFIQIDVNALPVHMFVKSPKEAKKVTRKLLSSGYSGVQKFSRNINPTWIEKLPEQYS